MRAEALRGEMPEGDLGWDPLDTQDAQQATYLMFRLGARIFAVDVRSVREVLVVCEILPLPKAPPDVVGVIDLRNQGIAIVDLASRLGMMPQISNDARIIVFEIDQDGAFLAIGVVADQVLRVIEVADEDIEPVARTGTAWPGSGVEGVIRSQEGNALILRIQEFLVTDQSAGEHAVG